MVAERHRGPTAGGSRSRRPATLAAHDRPTSRRHRRPRAAADGARPRIFSGIQPSGIVHLGNDLGAIRNYVALAEQYEAIYCIVDYHALTSTHDADVLRARTREMAAGLLALGLTRIAARCSSRAIARSTPS